MPKLDIIRGHFKQIRPYPFPIDMLRYDSCYPATEKDAGLIQQTQNGHEVTEEICVAKTPINKVPWNVARWESFGWQFVKDEKEY